MTGLFHRYAFHLWRRIYPAENDFNATVITDNGGTLRRAFIRDDGDKIKVVLFSSLADLRANCGVLKRLRESGEMMFDFCVSTEFVTESLNANTIQDIENYTFDGLLSRSVKKFCLGEMVTASPTNYFVPRDEVITYYSDMILQSTETPAFFNLYNHSQAGKSSTLNELVLHMSKDETLNVVLCSFTGEDVFEQLYRAFGLQETDIGGLGTYVHCPDKRKIGIEQLLGTSVHSKKPIVLFGDNLDSLKEAPNAQVFFDTLKVIRERKHGHLKAFVGVGVYRSDSTPGDAKSHFKFLAGETVRFETYFDINDIEYLGDLLRNESGIHLSHEICREIHANTGGHPGYVAFYFDCILNDMKFSPVQMDLANWRRISTGEYFSERLASVDLGRKLRKFLQFLDNGIIKEVLTSLLVAPEKHIVCMVGNLEFEDAVNKMSDHGLIHVDVGSIIRFSCDVIWSQIMSLFCSTQGYGPQIVAQELQSLTMLDFLKRTLPFIKPSQISVLLSSKDEGSVPSEYAYQFELNKIFSHAVGRCFRVFNECNDSLRRRRADIRILNGTNWAVLELMSHATDQEFVEHIQRTCETYSVLNPKHLAVIQFHTVAGYKVPAEVLKLIREKKGLVDVFVVVHDQMFTTLKIQHVGNGDSQVIDTRQFVAAATLISPGSFHIM